jgi:rhamnogalacturonyl hydrolase YesR
VTRTGGVSVSGGAGVIASAGGVGGALSGNGGATWVGGTTSAAGSKATAGTTGSGGAAGGTNSGGAGGVGGKTGSGGTVVAGSGGSIGGGSGGSVVAGSGGRTGGSGGSLGWAVRMADSVIARHPDPDTVSGNHFSWETGYTMWALEKVWRSSGDPKYFAYLKKYVDQHVDASGNLTGFSASALDNFLPGYAILLLFEETKDPRYSTAAGVIRKAFDTYPRNSDGGFWHNTGLKGQMWVDGVFMGQMFLARYAHAVGDSTYAFGEVVKQMTDIVNHCMKANGLLLHAYDETKKASWADPTTGLAAEVWSEGLGWYTVLIADVLDYLPADHVGRPQLLDILGKLVAGLKANQDAQSGRWCQVVDKCTLTDNWNESSGTGMFLYLIKRAIDRGYVDAATYGSVVDNAYKGLVQKATTSGATVDIHDCSSIGVQNTYSDYVSKPKQVSPPSCVASFIAGTGIVESPSPAPTAP